MSADPPVQLCKPADPLLAATTQAPMYSVRVSYWQWGLVAVLLLVATARRSAAQLGALFGAVQVDPDTLVLSDTMPTTTFTLSNSAAEPSDVWLDAACDAVSDSAEDGDPVADAWHNHSTCVAPWLSDYPQHIVLAPHEERKVSMRVIPPSTLPDGHYAARLIWAIAVANVTTTGDTTGRGVQHGELAITYAKGSQPSRRSRIEWRATSLRVPRVSFVEHTPAVLELDDHHRTTSVTLTNPGVTPTEVWLAVDCPWFRVNFINYPDSHQYESAWHGRIPSAAFWVSGYPQHLTLAPHEQRTLTLTAFPDLRAGPQPAGSYYARLVYVQAPIVTVPAPGDTTYTTPTGAIPMVYHRGAAQQLTVSELRVSRGTSPLAGSTQACVHVEQPGLGVVARLYATVEDAQHHPVRALATVGRAGALPLGAWALDTTVAVWEVVHHDPMDGAQDGALLRPTPVCFPLPVLATGHYQLVVSAAALEDLAKHQAIRATAPLDIP